MHEEDLPWRQRQRFPALATLPGPSRIAPVVPRYQAYPSVEPQVLHDAADLMGAGKMDVDPSDEDDLSGPNTSDFNINPGMPLFNDKE